MYTQNEHNPVSFIITFIIDKKPQLIETKENRDMKVPQKNHIDTDLSDYS